MPIIRTRRVPTVLAAVVLGGSLLFTTTACGSKGGDTKCKDYVEMDGSDQRDVIKDFLEEDGGDPSTAKVFLTQQSAKVFCKTAGSDDSPIKDING